MKHIISVIAFLFIAGCSCGSEAQSYSQTQSRIKEISSETFSIDGYRTYVNVKTVCVDGYKWVITTTPDGVQSKQALEQIRGNTGTTIVKCQ